MKRERSRLGNIDTYLWIALSGICRECLSALLVTELETLTDILFFFLPSLWAVAHLRVGHSHS